MVTAIKGSTATTAGARHQAGKRQRQRVGDGERGHHLDQRQSPAPQNNRDQNGDVVVAEEDMLDAGRDEPAEDLQTDELSPVSAISGVFL